MFHKIFSKLKAINQGGNRILIWNTFMQYILYIAQMLFPLITMPYLTRVLSVPSYGIYTYSNSCMTYVSLIINYGFILSATRDVARAGDDKGKISLINSRIITAKLLLMAVSFVVLLGMLLWIEMFCGYELFLLLTFAGTVLNAFLPDYLFRGIERMDVLTYRFLICKTVSTLLIFVLIRDDGDYMMLPVLNIISAVIALAWSRVYEVRNGYHLVRCKAADGVQALKEGFLHFISNSASTAFNAANTFMIGLFFSASDIAYWGAALQLVSAAQGLYGPISTSLYPRMVKNRDSKLLKTTMLIFMPMIVVAVALCMLLAEWIITMFYGPDYLPAAGIFRLLVLVLLFSFPSVMLGWPALGAIAKVKEITFSAVASAVLQILLLMVLAVFQQFTIVNVCILRIFTEMLMVIMRGGYCIKYRAEFSRKE